MSLLAMSKGKRREQRTPARENLALKLNEFIGVRRALAEAQNTHDRAQDLCRQTQERFDIASAAASAARQNHAEAALRSARTGESFGAGASRDLRVAEADAADDLDAVKAALATSEEALGRASIAHDEAVKAIGLAADGVVAEALPKYMEAAMKAAELLFKACEPLQYIGRLQAVPVAERNRAFDFAQNIRLYLVRTLSSFAGREFELGEWESARATLTSDPDAPLPPLL